MLYVLMDYYSEGEDENGRGGDTKVDGASDLPLVRQKGRFRRFLSILFLRGESTDNLFSSYTWRVW